MPTLQATAPFDFRQTLRFLGAFPPSAGEQTTAGELRKATRWKGQTVGFVVRGGEQPLALDCEFFPEHPLTHADTEGLLDRVRHFLNLDDDLGAFYDRARQDPPFRPVLERLNGFHQPRFLTPFEVACWAVITQRLPEAQARAIKRTLATRSGGEWQGLSAFPEAADLAGLEEAAFLGIVPNERKARALVSLTRAFAGVSTPELLARPTEEVRAWLLGLYGIGEWSALFILVRGLGRTELLAELDDGSPLLKELLRAARPVYGELTPAGLLTHARSYGEQAGHWAGYLRSAVALGGPQA